MIRDKHSNALIETDLIELEKYRKQKSRDREFQDLKREVHSLKVSINNLCATIQKIEDRI
jgi:hypothetical protein